MKLENNNYDEIDKMFFEQCEKNTEIPESTKYIIHNAFNLPRRRHKTSSYIYNLQKVAIFLITFSIMTTSIVFAKDIVNFINKIFTNSTKGIDVAVENGYLQNVDMDFVFDNNIGIKTDNLVIDENNLDVSFIYYTDIPDIINIEIDEFTIRDENNNIICTSFKNQTQFNERNLISSHYVKSDVKTIDSNSKFTESILCSSLELPKLNNLTFEIISFTLVNSNGNQTKQEGNWLYSINIDNNVMRRITENYSTSYDKSIETISAEQSETSLKIEIELNEKINEDVLLNEIDNIKLTNINNERYNYLYIHNSNDENSHGHLTIEFDISSYTENTDSLNLFILYDTNKSINIHLSK